MRDVWVRTALTTMKMKLAFASAVLLGFALLHAVVQTESGPVSGTSPIGNRGDQWPAVPQPSPLITFETVEADRSSKEIAKRYELRFPDGSVSTVTLRPYEADVELLEIASLSDRFEELDRLARGGDASAAFSLAHSLQSCSQDAYETESEFRDAIAMLESELRVPNPQGKGFVEWGSDFGDTDVEGIIQELSDVHTMCRGVTRAQRSLAGEYLKLAADNGSFVALSQLAHQLPQTSDEKLRYLHDAWDEGDFNAALWIGAAYFNGTMGADTDRVRGFAYQFVSLQITRLVFTDRQGTVSPVVQSILNGQNEKMNKRALELSHAEHAEALELAREILDSASGCCIGLWASANSVF